MSVRHCGVYLYVHISVYVCEHDYQLHRNECSNGLDLNGCRNDDTNQHKAKCCRCQCQYKFIYIQKKTDIFKEMWRSLCLHRDILSLCVYDYVLFVWMRRQIEVAWKFREIRQKKRDKEELNEEKSKLRRWNTKTGGVEGGVVEFKMRYIYIFPI